MSPELQWLGQLPREPDIGSYVAEALGGGLEEYWKQRERVEERAVDLAKISYDKKKESADMIVDMLDYATPQQRDQILAEGSDTSKLLLDVYGEEAVDVLRGVTAGKGVAKKLAKIDTWIATKQKPSPTTGLTVPLDKQSMDTAIALELNDINWKTTYPERAAAFEAAYPTTKKVERRGLFRRKERELTARERGEFQREYQTKPYRRAGAVDYRNMSEQELFNKAMAGDSGAIQEAIRRGYPVGGR